MVWLGSAMHLKGYPDDTPASNVRFILNLADSDLILKLNLSIIRLPSSKGKELHLIEFLGFYDCSQWARYSKVTDGFMSWE